MSNIVGVSTATMVNAGFNAIVGAGFNAANSKLFDISKPQAVFSYHIGVIAASIPLQFVTSALEPLLVKYGIPNYIFLPLVLAPVVIGLHKSGKAAAKWYCNTDVTFKDSLKLYTIRTVELLALEAMVIGQLETMVLGQLEAIEAIRQLEAMVLGQPN